VSMTDYQRSKRRADAEREAFAAARGYVAENPLRSCPLCGGPAGVLAVGYIEDRGDGTGPWKSAVQIGCTDETCAIAIIRGGVVGAADKWNRRANEGKPHISDSITTRSITNRETTP